ncbi:MAG: hypothetical protein IJ722_07035 [Alloprevotella sp.]|nr:hypothetical protein [Alloprevotella sp.]
MQQQDKEKKASAHEVQAEVKEKIYVSPRMEVIPLGCQLLAASGGCTELIKRVGTSGGGPGNGNAGMGDDRSIILGCDILQTVDFDAVIDAYMTDRCNWILENQNYAANRVYKPYCEGGWQAHAEEYWYRGGSVLRLGALNDAQMDYIRRNGTMTGCEMGTSWGDEFYDYGYWETSADFTLDGKCYTLIYRWGDYS